MIRRPPRSTLFPTRRSSDLGRWLGSTPWPGCRCSCRPPCGWPSSPAGAGLPINDKLEIDHHATRSEEHTSELQSRQYLVCRLLLGKKNNRTRLTSSHDITSY